jgi:hypothetical protein
MNEDRKKTTRKIRFLLPLIEFVFISFLMDECIRVRVDALVISYKCFYDVSINIHSENFLSFQPKLFDFFERLENFELFEELSNHAKGHGQYVKTKLSKKRFHL